MSIILKQNVSVQGESSVELVRLCDQLKLFELCNRENRHECVDMNEWPQVSDYGRPNTTENQNRFEWRVFLMVANARTKFQSQR